MNGGLRAALALALVACPPAAAQREKASREAAALFEDYYEEYLRLFPRIASEVGDHRYDHRFENDIDEGHRERERELYTRCLERAGHVDRDALGPDERMSLDVFRELLGDYLEGLRFPEHLLPIDQMRCTPADFADMGAGKTTHPFETVDDYENFLARVDGFEEWVETAIRNMQKGMERHLTVPKLVAQSTIERIRVHVVADPEESVFFEPVRNMPASFTDEEREMLTDAYRRTIAERIVPAYAGLVDFLEQEYLPACRDSLGWSELPGGREWYAYLVRSYTTTDLTPDEIFDLGMAEVKRIATELAGARERSDAAGEMVRYDSVDALAAAYRAIQARVEPEVGKLFTRFPRTALEIAPGDWGSYYEPGSDDATRAGVFRFEAGDLAANPQGTSEALFLHEAIPGHHYQISLQRESGLPRFRRGAFFYAYMEGWGLYAESLGPELGLYRDPHQELLRLGSEMIRAMRLVLDVGFHARGWTMEDAYRFLGQYGYGEGMRWELERYVAWPGQALTYKVGELTIRRLRDRARAELGEDFDLAAFHDVVLGTGAVPLDLLERRVERWIAERR